MDDYIGYIRVSNKEHENSLPAQERKLKEYAKSKGLNLVKIYKEEQSAFGKTDRKKFAQMIKHLKQKGIVGVIFHKVDRSARNMKDFSLIDGFMETKDIRVIEGEFDTKTAAGKMMFRTFCNMAVWYSENLSEEVILKMREQLKRGYYPSKQPFGYRKGMKNQDLDMKKKYPDHNAKYVKELFEMYDTGNYNYVQLAKYMRQKGVQKSKCTPFSKKHVENILCQTFYYGLIRWKSRKTGQITEYQGNHEPLISKELFDRVKVRRMSRTRSQGGYGKNIYSRRVYCSCDRLLYPETPTPKNKKRIYSYLRCHDKSCDFSSIRTDELENLISEQLMTYELKPKFFEVYQKAMEGLDEMIVEENERHRESMNLRLTQIEAEMQKIRKGFIQEVFTGEEAAEMRKSLELEKSELMERLKEESSALDSAYFKTAEQFLETFKVLSMTYKTAPNDIKKEILELFFSKLFINGKKLLVELVPVVQKVVNVRNSYNGWGGGIHPETVKRVQKSLLHIKNYIKDNDYVRAVERVSIGVSC